MNVILAELSKSEKFLKLIKKIENNEKELSLCGINDMGMAQMLSRN